MRYADAWPRQGLLRFADTNETANWPYAVHYPALCAAIGTMPPGLGGIEELIKTLSAPKAAQLVGFIRTAANKAPPFAAVLWHNRALLAPERYPESVQGIFPVDPIPTPSSVLQWLVGPRANVLRDFDADARFVLVWWHLGTPLEHLDAFGRLSAPAEQVLQRAISLLLKRHTFFFWALGDDLLPLTTTPGMQMFVKQHLIERTSVRLPNLSTNSLLHHPYIVALLARREALRPISRIDVAPHHIFRSETDKMVPIFENPPTFSRFCMNRRFVRPRIAQDARLEWADLTPFPEESNAPRKILRTKHPVAAILAERRKNAARSRQNSGS